MTNILKYSAKNSATWKKLLINNLPKGDITNSALVEGKIPEILMEAYGICFARFDQYLDETMNGLLGVVTKDSILLDNWWKELKLGDTITKPSDPAITAGLIKLFLRAKVGLFTYEQIENLINEIFGIYIKIRLISRNEANSNIYNMTYDYAFLEDIDEQDALYTVIIEFPATTGREDYKTIIKQVLRKIININYKVIYMDND